MSLLHEQALTLTEKKISTYVISVSSKSLGVDVSSRNRVKLSPGDSRPCDSSDHKESSGNNKGLHNVDNKEVRVKLGPFRLPGVIQYQSIYA